MIRNLEITVFGAEPGDIRYPITNELKDRKTTWIYKSRAKAPLQFLIAARSPQRVLVATGLSKPLTPGGSAVSDEVTLTSAPSVPNKLRLGDSCTLGVDTCATGFCVDGVCCDSACDGACNTCVGAVAGKCSLAPAGTSPRNACPVDTMNPCGNDGTCDGAGACRVGATGKLAHPAAPRARHVHQRVDVRRPRHVLDAHTARLRALRLQPVGDGVRDDLHRHVRQRAARAATPATSAAAARSIRCALRHLGRLRCGPVHRRLLLRHTAASARASAATSSGTKARARASRPAAPIRTRCAPTRARRLAARTPAAMARARVSSIWPARRARTAAASDDGSSDTEPGACAGDGTACPMNQPTNCAPYT